MTQKASPNWKRIARILGTLLSLGLLIYLLSRQGWTEIVQAFSRIQLSTLLLAAVLVVLSRFAVVGRWYSLLRSADIPFTLYETTKITFAGLFAANYLPTTIGGDVVRFAEVAKIQNKKAAFTASIVMDRAVGLLGMAALLPLGLLHALDELNLFKNEVAIGPLLLASTGARVREFLKQYILSPVKAFLKALKIWLHNPIGLMVSFFFTGLHMLCRFGALWLIFRDQGEAIGFLEIASLWSLVYFITLVPISLNGLGLQEISTTFMYTQVGGVTATSALTIALLIRTLEMAASLPGSIFLPALIGQNLGDPED